MEMSKTPSVFIGTTAFRSILPLVAALSFWRAPTALGVGTLQDAELRELMSFSWLAVLRAPMPATTRTLSEAEILELVATGINTNGYLCARVVRVLPLRVRGTYEVSCVAYRDGSATKPYIVNAWDGAAFEP